jgi:hypothetical protein
MVPETYFSNSCESVRAIRTDSDRRIAIACFGTACAIGLVFAFVGLETHSLWYDELFTATLLEPMRGSTLLSRIATDVHPPLYLLALALFTQLFGDGDAALRCFSAIAACGAVVVFILATRPAFSLPARLFGAAMATGSLFWFTQAQNARSYALCLLISAGVMALGLSLLQERQRRRRRLTGLLALMITGALVHFYVTYVCLAVLILLGLFKRRPRGAERCRSLPACGRRSVREAGDRALFTGVACRQLVPEQSSLVPRRSQGLPAILARGPRPGCPPALRRCNPLHTTCTGEAICFDPCRSIAGALVSVRSRDSVPGRGTFARAGGGIVSSTLLAPNFWDRFPRRLALPLGLAARSYDAAVEKATLSIRLALTSALAIIVLSMSSIVTGASALWRGAGAVRAVPPIGDLDPVFAGVPGADLARGHRRPTLLVQAGLRGD